MIEPLGSSSSKNHLHIKNLRDSTNVNIYLTRNYKDII